MELQYDKEIKEIQRVIDYLNEKIISIQNDELDVGEIGKQKIPIILKKRINSKIQRKKTLEELQKPIEVSLAI